jgi:hypothetical protein
MDRVVILAHMAAKYAAAGYDVSIAPPYWPDPSEPCFVCDKRCGVSSARVLSVSDLDRKSLNLCYMHATCAGPLNTECNLPINPAPRDSLLSISTACWGYSAIGRTVSACMVRHPGRAGCSVCGKHVSGDIHSIGLRGKDGMLSLGIFHSGCFGPFSEEYARVRRAHVRDHVFRAWLLAPLVDCRIVIARLLCGPLLDNTQIYGAMFGAD